MRLIKEMIRVVLKLIFHIYTESPTEEMLEDLEVKVTLNALLDMVDERKINEAENVVHEITENGEYKNLETVLLFYSYLNEKPDGFWEKNNFSQDEVKEGPLKIVFIYRFGSVANTFLKRFYDYYRKASII